MTASPIIRTIYLVWTEASMDDHNATIADLGPAIAGVDSKVEPSAIGRHLIQ